MPHVVTRKGDTSPEKITCGIMRGLVKSKDFDKLDIAHIKITKTTKKHYHNKLTEFYYILKGILNVNIDGNIENLKEGDIIMISPGTIHEAHSKQGAEILVICSPQWTEEDEILVDEK